MSFEHACFISYRHRDAIGYSNNIKKLRNLLNEQLSMQFNGAISVFLDTERLTVGNKLNPTLAKKICKSVSFIAVWIPPYFDKNSLYCSKEYYAMEHLEKKRNELLKDDTLSFIHIIAFARPDKIPTKLSKVESRLFADFKDYIVDDNWDKLPKVRIEISKIADYIGDRYDQLKVLGVQPFEDCLTDFPDDATVLKWLGNFDQISESKAKAPTHYDQPK